MARAVWRDPAVVSHWMEDIGASIKHGVVWVKNGFRLFYKNLQICRKLVWKGAMGHQLSLRESKLLVTTTSDLCKLVPFSLFIIIPFAELALPIFLRVFPNMLPSTFMEQAFDNASVARRQRAKKELADFFHHVIEDRNRREVAAIARSSGSAAGGDHMEELEAFRSVMAGSALPRVTELVRFAKLFENEFKLENMETAQLQHICRMLGLEPFGFKTHVVLQLRHYVNRLQAEDRRILWEGVESLTPGELVDACHARGMPTSGVAVDALRTQLENWLQLSSCKEVPVSLLLMSRTSGTAFASPHAAKKEETENPEELFETTAERQKERAEDVKRRLEELDAAEEGVGEEVVGAEHGEAVEEEEELDRGELLEKNARLEEELEVLNRVVEKQGEIFLAQLAILAKLQQVPWNHLMGSRGEAVKVRHQLNSALAQFEREVGEVNELLQESKRIRLSFDDHRFYPSDSDGEDDQHSSDVSREKGRGEKDVAPEIVSPTSVAEDDKGKAFTSHS